MNPYTERALLLLDHSRYREAEDEARQALQMDPDDAFAIAALAFCFSKQKRTKEAVQAAQTALGKAPDVAYFHWVYSRILIEQDRPDEAFQAIENAIRLDPQDADYHALKAALLVDRKKWVEALGVVQRGLEVDPEHERCINLRSICLTKTGQVDHAVAVLDGALSRNPDNAYTHANKGWALLHAGDYQRAEMHFREALRLNPDLERARQGILHSLRSRHFFYRPLLSYFLWISRVSGRRQWMFIMGLWVGAHVLENAAHDLPFLRLILYPALALYAVFVYLSWTAVPLTDLFLFLHPLGRLALTREEKQRSLITGLTLFTGLASAAIGLASSAVALLFFGGLCVLMVIPMAASLGCPSGNRRLLLLLFMMGLWAAGLGFVFLAPPVKFRLLAVFVLGFVGFSIMGNVVGGRA